MGGVNKNILYILKTREDARILLSFVDFLSEETHKTIIFDVEKLIFEFFGEREMPIWISFIRDYFSLENAENPKMPHEYGESYYSGVKIRSVPSMDNIRTFLEEVGTSVRNAETVKIEIPFNPSEEFINNAYEILGKSNMFSLLGKKKTGFLLDVLVTKSKGKDTRIFVAGKVVDLSIKKIVINYLRSKDVINRYL